MRRSIVVLAAFALALLVAPAPSPAATPGADAGSLRAAELAFAKSVHDNDRASFAAAIADDAVFVDGGKALRGKAAIVEAWAGFFGPSAESIAWHPELAEVQDGGALGITRGPWTWTGKDKDGKPATASGIFNSVWRREKDGGWKVIFDMGCPPCPCAAKQ